MATYLELRNLFDNDVLRSRIEVAVAVAADAIREESVATPGHQARLAWASEAWSLPNEVARRMQIAVLAANKGATVAQINQATDSQLQSKVNDAINVFAGVTS